MTQLKRINTYQQGGFLFSLEPPKEEKHTAKELFKDSTINDFGTIVAPMIDKWLTDHKKYHTEDDVIRIAKQMAYESEYGKSNAAQSKNNLGGIKKGKDNRSFNTIEDYLDFQLPLLINRYDVLWSRSDKDYVNRLHGQNKGGYNYSGEPDGYHYNIPRMTTVAESLKDFIITNPIPYAKSGGTLKRIPSGKSGIHIKPENKGKFTEYCGGKVTSECIARGKKSPNPKIRKQATFAGNARSWHKK